MKRFLRLLMLMMNLLCLGLAPPAAAQTPLLEVDYNGATIFHVLNDGRLLLPVGAQDGYVLTATAAGFATWQAVSGSGGAVTSDVTLTGDGTPGNPLGVSVPLVLTGSGGTGVVRGNHSNGSYGYLGGSTNGVVGNNSTGSGVNGQSSSGYGVAGTSSSSFGVFGISSSSRGVYGQSFSGVGVWGFSNGGFGVYGESTNSTGIVGISSSSNGIRGESDSGVGVSGFSPSGIGVRGSTISGNGVYGVNGNRWGALGTSASGVTGSQGTNTGYLGLSTVGVFGQAQGADWAGYFSGHAHVTQNFSVGGTKNFKIDHPLDPAGKYLYHFSIESDEVLNVYSGTVHLNDQGEAHIALPDWMEALNTDFRYQLTPIGAPAPHLYLAEELAGNQFKVAGGAPGMKVSWQVTGVRSDPAVRALQPAVEEAKPPSERGYYMHPQAYGQPPERHILWAREPELMREMQTMPARLEAERLKSEQERRRVPDEQ